jgi:hypothetical protein
MNFTNIIIIVIVIIVLTVFIVSVYMKDILATMSLNYEKLTEKIINKVQNKEKEKEKDKDKDQSTKELFKNKQEISDTVRIPFSGSSQNEVPLKDFINKNLEGPVTLCFPKNFNYLLKDSEVPNILVRSDKYYFPIDCLVINGPYSIEVEELDDLDPDAIIYKL